MTNLPRGTVTFLFTDIEGSTQLWDAFPDDMRFALGMHDAIVSNAVGGHGGHVVKQTGDGVFAAFASAIDAGRAAIAVRQGLSTADWPSAVQSLSIRMALHTGSIEPEGGDYHGPDVNRVARIEASAHGGQTLVSATTAALITRAGLPSVELIDLGTHLLRGLSDPERIYQLSVPGHRAVFPPLRTASSIETCLPTFPTSFFGRRLEIAEITDTLADPACRLLTLIGPGGIGKTRLAVEAAAAFATRTGVPAHFLSLVGIAEAAQAVKTLADSIGFTFDIHISAQIPEKAQLLDRLRSQQLLLVLDNLEHLAGIGELIAEMIAEVPSLLVLATSRIHLDASAEWRYEVRGLDDRDTRDGAALFVDRVRRAGGSVDPEADRPVIEALAARLGSMPLAIELAAAWGAMLSPAEIAKEIETDLGILETSTVDTQSRHRSIRSVFEHSWRLLPDDLKPTYARLSVFRAPFDRTAAEGITGASLGDLAQLSKRSLISRHGIDGHSLHPLLREFAAEQAEARDPQLASRFARFYWDFLIDRASQLQGGPDQMLARDEVAGALDHLRAAADHWVEHSSDADTTAAIRALHEFYFIHSWVEQSIHFKAMMGRFDEVYGAGAIHREAYLWASVLHALNEVSFSTPDENAALLAAIEAPWRERGGDGWAIWLLAKGIEHALRGDYQASLAAYEESLDAADQWTPVFNGMHSAWCGWSYLQMGEVDKATDVFDRGLEKATTDGHYLGRAFLLSKYGLAAEAAGDHLRAAELHHEGREIFVKAGDIGGQGYTLSRLSWSHYLRGEYETARRYALEGLAMFEVINHRWGIAVSYGRLGLAEVGLNRIPEALGHFLTCLHKAREAGLIEQQHYAITGIGTALAHIGHHDQAAALLEFEADHQSNPYAGFAVAALAGVPPEARGNTTIEGLDLDDVIRLTIDWAGTGAGSPPSP